MAMGIAIGGADKMLAKAAMTATNASVFVLFGTLRPSVLRNFIFVILLLKSFGSIY